MNSRLTAWTFTLGPRATTARFNPTSAAKDAARYRMSIRMTKETTPLWVWLSVALLAIGALTYATAVYFVEYIIGFF